MQRFAFRGFRWRQSLLRDQNFPKFRLKGELEPNEEVELIIFLTGRERRKKSSITDRWHSTCCLLLTYYSSSSTEERE